MTDRPPKPPLLTAAGTATLLLLVTATRAEAALGAVGAFAGALKLLDELID